MLDILRDGIENVNVNLEYNWISEKTIAKMEKE